MLRKYCRVNTDKKYQRADWRERPLSEEMLLYARMDTHYLIYIYEALKRDFSSLRTGKVTTGIVDNIKVDYYGTMTALNQVGNVIATDATTISITPWEKTLLPVIEKAIQEANIGVNPNNDGDFIILNYPPMTVEQRQESVKKLKGMGENAKVAIRNNRKSARY